MLGTEAGLGADWETESGDAAGNGVVVGAEVAGEDAEVQARSEGQILIVVLEELAGCAAIVGW